MHIHSCNNQTIQNVQRFDFPTHTYDFIQPLNIPNTLFKVFITKCIYKAHKHNWVYFLWDFTPLSIKLDPSPELTVENLSL